MRKTFTLVIPLLLFICFNALAQSNKGTEFYTAFMRHHSGPKLAAMVLYITSDVSTHGRVEIAGINFSKNFSVAANTVTFVDIPAAAHIQNQGTFNKAIHIVSEKPIAVYAHIYASAVSGATLLLPVNAMGKEYISLNYTQVSNINASFSTFAVVGVEDGTRVSITPTVPTLDDKPAGVPYEITLNKGEVYQGISRFDLTGTKIKSVTDAASGESCKKIAVFSGSTKIGIGCYSGGNTSSDNFFQQVYPTNTWGRNFVTAPLSSRPYDVYRVVLSSPNTTVKINGIEIKKFVKKLYHEFSSATTNIISANKPIQVIQYSVSQGEGIDCKPVLGDTGDPEMIYLSPVEQGLNAITLYSTSRYAILRSFINVIIPTAAVSTFTLDGIKYEKFDPVAGSEIYSYAQIPVATGSHTINAALPFNAIAYGFGIAESYGYAAGTNLRDIEANIGLQNKKDADNLLPAGCSDQTYNLQVMLPYPTNIIRWTIDGKLMSTVTKPETVKTPFLKNGKMIHVYQFEAPVNFKAGSHTLSANVFNPVSDNCGSYVDVESVLRITDPTTGDFSVSIASCLGEESVFKANTDSLKNGTIKSWLWEFGDGTTSAAQNPRHKYAEAGDYSCRLTVTDINGCFSISNAKMIHIKGRPKAKFSFNNNCVRQVIFNDQSLSPEPASAVSGWLWDFGDGTISTEKNPVHTFTTAKLYQVKLLVTANNGCVSEPAVMPVAIKPIPVASFVVGDLCAGDQRSQFRSTSTITDGTDADLTYFWDFGDQNGDAINNTSSLKDPLHAYALPGVYKVKLKVVSKHGCDSTVSRIVKVNGRSPVAAFSLLKTNTYCSSDSVAFMDQSTVDLGNVTKLEWYFDFENPDVKPIIIDKAHLRSDRIYRYLYGQNHTASAKRYRVVLYAYSGESCFSVTQPQEIVVNPAPIVKLKLKATGNTLPDNFTVCQSEPAFTIEAQANIAGKPKFSGPGITRNGSFDPKIAGAGKHTISIVFTADESACTYIATFNIIVSPSPLISLQAKYELLDGEQLVIKPMVSMQGGGKLFYKWSPAIGLNTDTLLTPLVSTKDDVVYTLSITSAVTGCTSTASTLVKVLKAPLVPNAFTPNGDGRNDTWEVKYLDNYPTASVEVFNRSGVRVYFANRYSVPWDGTKDGRDLPIGTYYYIIKPNGGRQPMAGNVAIIR